MEALGDELLADEDSSYLDEAASVPSIPEGAPTEAKNKVSLSSPTHIQCRVVVEPSLNHIQIESLSEIE